MQAVGMNHFHAAKAELSGWRMPDNGRPVEDSCRGGWAVAGTDMWEGAAL
jgi:hypothetical protein